MKVLRTALLMTLIFAATAMAGTWQSDLALAEKLLDSGYYEAAVEDFQKIITAYPDLVPAVDRAWCGMGRAYHVMGNIDASKVALEKCLERNQDETAANSAREIYRQLKSEAALQRSESEKAVQFFESRYNSTSWLNIVTKLFDYFDLRKARKKFTETDEYDKTFNPRYLIDSVYDDSDYDDSVQTTFTLTADEMDKLLNKVATGQETEDNTLTDTIADDDVKPVVEPDTAEPVVTTVVSDPHSDLAAKRDTYLEAYRKLQEALRGKNQLEVQQANTVFQAAQKAYKEAQQAVAGMQN